jgi:hypothetical protein
MFEGNQFREQLQQAIADETAHRGLERYEDSIIAFLQELAVSNESVLMESEAERPITARRGIPDALQSARSLVEEAANFTRADGRTTLTLGDMEGAYKIRFCSVWPFCR